MEEEEKRKKMFGRELSIEIKKFLLPFF